MITVTDVQNRSGQIYEGTELTQVTSFIEDVTGLIEDFIYPIEVPVPTSKSLVAIAVTEVRRHLEMAPGVASERLDVLSQSYAYGGAVHSLTPEAKTALRRWKRRVRGPIGSLQLVRPDRWDGVDPTTPNGLTVSEVTQTEIRLTWTASFDNEQVAGYEVLEGTALVADVCEPEALLQGLLPATSHTYTVRAYDGVGRRSDPSAPVTGVTLT